MPNNRIRNARERKLRQLIEYYEPRISAAFMASIDDIKDSAVLSEIVRALETGNIEDAVRAIGMDRAALAPVEDEIARAFERGGREVAQTLSLLRAPDGARVTFRFDVRNLRAENWLRQHSSDMVTRTIETQREAIRMALQDGMRAGINPRTTALDIIGRIDPRSGRRVGGIVGLSGPQERFVANARGELLDSTPESLRRYLTRERRDRRFDNHVARALSTGESIDRATVQRMVGRYSDRLLQLRGETIGRTESLKSLNKAQDESFRQVVDTGAVDPQAVRRRWSSGGDDRVRDSHAAMDSEEFEVGLDEPFRTPRGASLMHPGDTSLGAPPEEIINCRCAVQMKIDHLRGIT